METRPDRGFDTEFRTSFRLFASVALISAAVIALQISVMRIFAVGSWTHFGSMVISLAMLGFGLSSVVIFAFKNWFEANWKGAAGGSLIAFGPVTVGANLTAQAFPFNAVFLASDPAQKWRLALDFVLYLLPFLFAALFLGIVFLKSRTGFNRAYFADLAGAGGGGAAVLAALYLLAPEEIVLVPLGLWALASVAWFSERDRPAAATAAAAVAALTAAAYLALPSLTGIPAINVSQYKGISYARNFPDAERIYRNVSPFGDLQVYSSSYMHFAPGLSDNAAFNLPELPANIYAGMYIDGDGPEGVMRRLPPQDDGYYRYLPAYYPYVLEKDPRTFIVQFGGDISTRVALQAGSRSVTAAESNPAIVAAFTSGRMKKATGDILASPRLRLVGGDGRLVLEHGGRRYDVIDLSLADSVGLSNPGGFSVVEKYLYTRQAFLSYMRALSDHGILAVTVWNKEEPPKSVLKLYATIAAAARQFDRGSEARSLFVASSYLSTTTVLYRKGGFGAADIARLRTYTRSMSFDEIYSPGYAYDTSKTAKILSDYRASIYGNGSASADSPDAADGAGAPPPDEGAGASGDGGGDAQPMPATTMGRLAWHYLIDGGWPRLARRYVFDTRPLTDERPYFAGYEKFSDLPKTLDRLDLFQDDWGYLVLWATLGVALVASLPLVLLPLVLGRRGSFRRSPGKLPAIAYFACLGLGYIMVEVGLIGRFTLALSSPAVSAAVLITGMLVASGFGSLVSERLAERARLHLPVIAALIAAFLLSYAVGLAPALDWIGGFPYAMRLVLALILIVPPAFLMGFPMATGMSWLARRGLDHMFVWAWGVNGCFSVVGAAAVPLVATTFGLDKVLEFSAVTYLIAAVAFLAFAEPPRNATPREREAEAA